MHTQYPVYTLHAYKWQYWLSNKFTFKLEAMKLFHLLPSLFLLQLEVPQLSHLEVLSQLLSVSLDYWLVCLKHQMCQLQPCKRNIIYFKYPNKKMPNSIRDRFFKKVNWKVNLRQCPTPGARPTMACPDIAKNRHTSKGDRIDLIIFASLLKVGYS